MAKHKVNKSQAVREYLAANKNAKPSEVVEALKKKGIKVTAQQVSSIRYNAGKKPAKKKSGRKPAAVQGKVSVADLLDTQKFAESVGGVGKAKELLSAIEKLGG